jgi:hypothetical protein
MAGNHKSGRKPNPDAKLERWKKYTFYVKEYARTNVNGNIVEWQEEPYFQWFRRHHESQWQERLRAYMRADVSAWKRDHHWRCDCQPIGLWENWKHNRQPKCHLCGKYRLEKDRVMDMSYTERQAYYKQKADELRAEIEARKDREDYE